MDKFDTELEGNMLEEGLELEYAFFYFMVAGCFLAFILLLLV